MQSRNQLLSIQILRALAALVVVAGHAGQEMSAIAARTGVHAPYMGWFNWGWGVDIFFVISGFIMIHTSADHFGKPGAAREFLVRRLIRIVPLYWLMTTALIAGAFVAPRLLNVPIGDLPHIVASYLFIPDARPDGGIRPVVALGWTLNYEMFFYILFALAMLLPLRKGLTALFFVFALLIAAGQLGAWSSVPAQFWTSPLLAEFLFGVVIGLASRSGFRLSAREAFETAILALFAAFVLGPFLPVGEHLPEAIRSGVPAALLVAAGALGPDVRRAKWSRSFAYIGDASYALYLVHPFAIRPLREVWTSVFGASIPLPVYLFAAMIVATLVAAALHIAFEKPVTRWLNATRQTGTRDLRLGQAPA